MRLSRSDLVPMLAIVAGGAIGMATFGSVVAPPETVEPNFSVREEALQLDEVAVVVPTPCSTQRRVIESPSRIDIGNQPYDRFRWPETWPLIFVDGVRVYEDWNCVKEGLDLDDIEDMEVVLPASAVRRYGEEGAGGAIVLTLKEEARRQR